MLWLRVSGAASQLHNSQNIGYYSTLLHYDLNYPNPCFNQIELDLKRTFQELNE